MSTRFVALVSVLVIAVAYVVGLRVWGQPRAKGEETFEIPRTSWGEPDLQGIWTPHGMVTPPVERPEGFGQRAYLTDEEVVQAERTEREAFGRAMLEESGPRSVVEISAAASHEKGIVGAEYNNFWIERPQRPRKVWRRTSLVIDPPDGRIPPLTLKALERLEAREHARRLRGQADTWEDRNVNERCISTASSGLNEQLDSNSAAAVRHILQIPQQVAMLFEMTGLYRLRIIPLDGRPHVPDRIRLWGGDARGRWEGDTLVIETTNINSRQDGGPIMPSRRPYVFYMGSGETLRLIERYRRIDAETLEYQYTVDDPETYVRPYTIAFPLTRDDSYRMLEVACHEGNYGLTNILTAGRADEESALETARIEAEGRRQRLQSMKHRTAEALKLKR